MEQPERLAPLELLDRLEQQVLKDYQERKVCLDLRDLLEQRERLAPLDLLDRWEQ